MHSIWQRSTSRGLSPFNPESVSIEAGRLMLRRINELIKKDESFSIETTLATRSYFRLVEQAHKEGFYVTLLFFWLESPELAVRRVAERVSKGGHDIPTDVILRRYDEGIRNLFNIFIPRVDYWSLIDNSIVPRQIIATGGLKAETNIYDIEKYNIIKNYAR